MINMRRVMYGGLAAMAPAAALAQPPRGPHIHPDLTIWMLLADAAPFAKIIIALLVAGAVAAIAITALKLMKGVPLAGGSAYLSSLRLGAPLLGIFGGILMAINMFLGLTVQSQTPPLVAVAPGIIEGLMILAAGFITGMVAVICHWAVESRIDRDVLGA